MPAADPGEAVLRQRTCRRKDCYAIFFICSRCDRGHCYCSQECRRQARLNQRRCANRRHQRSGEGRLDHRARQRSYRRRRRAALARATDLSSFSIPSPGIFAKWTGRCSRNDAASGGGDGVPSALPNLWPCVALHQSLSTHSSAKVSPADDQSRNPCADPALLLCRTLEDWHDCQ